MKFKYFYFIFSAVFLILSLFSIIKWGFKPSIEFTGGTVIKFEIYNLKFEMEDIKTIAKDSGIENPEMKIESGNYTLKSKIVNLDSYATFKTKIKEKGGEYQELSFETIGPVIGRELVFKTLAAVLLATLFILGYIAYTFKDKSFGIAATLATFHDTAILLGTFSLLGHFKGVEVDILFVTAVLTTLSFSVHDTIVVFDRIREGLKKNANLSFENLVNKAVTETLTRSINNSMTIIFMLTALFLLGGETIKWFVFGLLVGTISGTYSSTFTASPLLVVIKKIKSR